MAEHFTILVDQSSAKTLKRSEIKRTQHKVYGFDPGISNNTCTIEHIHTLMERCNHDIIYYRQIISNDEAFITKLLSLGEIHNKKVYIITANCTGPNYMLNIIRFLDDTILDYCEIGIEEAATKLQNAEMCQIVGIGKPKSSKVCKEIAPTNLRHNILLTYRDGKVDKIDAIQRNRIGKLSSFEYLRLNIERIVADDAFGEEPESVIPQISSITIGYNPQHYSFFHSTKDDAEMLQKALKTMGLKSRLYEMTKEEIEAYGKALVVSYCR